MQCHVRSHILFFTNVGTEVCSSWMHLSLLWICYFMSCEKSNIYHVPCEVKEMTAVGSHAWTIFLVVIIHLVMAVNRLGWLTINCTCDTYIICIDLFWIYYRPVRLHVYHTTKQARHGGVRDHPRRAWVHASTPLYSIRTAKQTFTVWNIDKTLSLLLAN